MEHKLIKTDNYLLVGVDDNIKRGWFYCVRTKSIFQDEGEDIHCCIGDIRIIAHLPLNNSPYLEGVDVLPPFEDDVEKLAIEEVGIDGQIYNISDNESFIKGYYKAKEKYKYTEEDIRRAIEMARTLVDGKNEFDVENILGSSDGTYGIKEKYTEQQIIQSLNQPTLPIAFECEIDNILSYNADDGIDALVNPNFGEPKTITNSQGLTEWVGEYKF
jgi:hypothetical protein